MHAQSVLTQIHSVIDITNSQLKLDPWRRLSHVATAASQCHRATEQTAESLPAGTAPTHTRSLTHQQNKHPPLSPQSLSLSLSLSLALSLSSPGVTVCRFTFPIWLRPLAHIRWPCRVPTVSIDSRRSAVSPRKPPTAPSVWALCETATHPC